MSRESPTADGLAADRPSVGGRYRHAATCLLLWLSLSSYVTLNFWGHHGAKGMDHGFPSEWMTRRVDDLPDDRADLRARLPLEWLGGDFSRVAVIDVRHLTSAVVWGAAIFVLLRRAGDVLFGRRAEPFYRFGLGRLLSVVAAIAVLFAVAAKIGIVESAQIALITTLLFVPLGAVGVVVEWYDRRTRRVLRERRQKEVVAGEASDLGRSAT
jgi:hypothetical protein